MRLIIAVLLAAVCFARRSLSEGEYKREFVDFVKKFEKTYEGYEYLERYEVFKDNIDKINAHNKKGLSWTAGVNQFTDLTEEEFDHHLRSSSLGFNRQMNNRTRRTEVVTGASDDCLQNGINWASSDNPQSAARITAVKNQGQCGSCWAFSTTGAIEGRRAIYNNAAPIPISEQELVDCSHQNNGCNGGLMDYAFEWVESNGLCHEDDYPYTASKHFFCRNQNCNGKDGLISSYKDVPQKDVSSMKNALCSGPVSVAIEADKTAFQMYSHGVFTGNCGTQLDHGVLAVGFGTESGKPYWLVKNSWGASWGESGYIKIGSEGNGNRCGILQSASYPVV